MLSKKLVATLGVLTATALAPATVAHAAPKPAPHVHNLGTQVGSEGIRSPQADGIIAILIGLVASPAGEPPQGHLVQGRAGGAHGCPACPHPAAVSIASDGIGVSYPNLNGSSNEPQGRIGAAS